MLSWNSGEVPGGNLGFTIISQIRICVLADIRDPWAYLRVHPRQAQRKLIAVMHARAAASAVAHRDITRPPYDIAVISPWATV